MNISQLKSGNLKRAVALLEKKELLLGKIAEIEGQVASLLGGDLALPAPQKAKSIQTGRRAKRGRRGEVAAAIVEVIQNAGAQGIRVKDIAQALGKPRANVGVWLRTTGKRFMQIQKLGRGLFAWQG